MPSMNIKEVITVAAISEVGNVVIMIYVSVFDAGRLKNVRVPFISKRL